MELSASKPAEGAPGHGTGRVGYLGPQGTFSEEALLASALEASVEPVALASIEDAVAALREGGIDWAIVPIENSLDGSVTVTLDLLADHGGEVRIVGEALLAVRHALIAAAPIAVVAIETVLTHPQVPGQCRKLLRGELAHAQVLFCASTAEAVRAVVSSGEPGRAAIGTMLAAEIYGGTVVREDVQDRMDNETRFAWLARVEQAAVRPPLRARTNGAWKTSLVFWGAGSGSAGWLVRCLAEFAQREINLTKIESRPRRGRMGSYMFFVDAEARGDEKPLQDALEGLRGLCEEVVVLGSYRAATATLRA
jgi:prephenate dehydratase